MKTERDASFRQAIVTVDLPPQFHYSKNSEIINISVWYGQFNRLGQFLNSP